MASPTKPQILLILFFFFILTTLSHSRSPHIITILTPNLHPSALAWDPTDQHFLIASTHHHPSISSVSDAGVVSSLISPSLLPPQSHIAAISIDTPRRRLLVALSNPASLAAFNLLSPHQQLFFSPFPDPNAVPRGVAVDPFTGDAFVTIFNDTSIIWKLDLEGRGDVLSQSKIFGEGLDGVTHVRNGYLLVVQGSTGKVFKVDAEDGAARMVIPAGRELAIGAVAVAVTSDGTVVAGGRLVKMLKSDDAWGRAAVYDEIVIEEGGQARGVAVREGRKVYVLVAPDGEEEGRKSSGRIEEVEWEKDREGDMVWGMVLLGLGLAYFMYWRFQMGQLVGNMNKKRE